MAETILRTPLHAEHVALGGRMVPFAGYEMPVQYTGIIAESKAVREGAGMFDVSHMARLRFTGENVLEFLEWVTANDVSALGDMQGQYSLLPNANGGTVDDIIVYRLNAGEYHMVVNAANHAKDVAHLRSAMDDERRAGMVQMTDYTDSTAMIAVQGPKAAEILAGLSDDPNAILGTEFFGLVGGRFWGQEVFMARSGYTGEDGFEVICSNEFAPMLWNALREAGVVPCGLGSRDTLRVEAGLPLYGHELTDELSPIAAGLGWVISKTKRFLGSESINAARTDGVPRKIQGIRLGSKRLLTPGMKVFGGSEVRGFGGSEVRRTGGSGGSHPESPVANRDSLDGGSGSSVGSVGSVSSGGSVGSDRESPVANRDSLEIGEVTSGVYSPTFECGIAFALIDSQVPLDTPCMVDVRGTMEPGTIVSKRFLKREK